jgi:poly(3-hydroxybutyrate) depolymerase
MRKTDGPQFPSVAFLWPALAAEAASEFASAVAREFANLAVGPSTETVAPEPGFATRNKVALELTSVRLRDFSTAADGPATLVCAPFALHGATITDLAPRHSLVAALQRAGIERVFVTDWRSASADMRLMSIDNYVADLNLLVDELGGAVDLVGLCQGGWMALAYAARFPTKVRKLVLAGAPIDIAAGHSKLSDLARNTPMSVFKELVDLGRGRILGQRVRQLWALSPLDREAVHRLLQSPDAVGSAAFRRLEARFHEWYAWTVDLPGTYYLQVVEQLFKENRLAGGSFEILGRPIDLADVRCPLFLLAARDDDVVAPEQIFATEHLVDSRRCAVEKATAPCGHLGLFMGREILAEVWLEIARWLLR